MTRLCFGSDNTDVHPSLECGSLQSTRLLVALYGWSWFRHYCYKFWFTVWFGSVITVAGSGSGSKYYLVQTLLLQVLVHCMIWIRHYCCKLWFTIWFGSDVTVASSDSRHDSFQMLLLQVLIHGMIWGSDITVVSSGSKYDLVQT